MVVLEYAHIHAHEVHLADHAFGRRFIVDQAGRIGLRVVIYTVGGDLHPAKVGHPQVDIRHLIEVVGIPLQERLLHPNVISLAAEAAAIAHVVLPEVQPQFMKWVFRAGCSAERGKM